MASLTILSNPKLLEPEDLSLPLGNDDLLIQVTSAAVFAQAHIDGAVLVEPAQLCCGIAPAVGKLPALSSLQHGSQIFRSPLSQELRCISHSLVHLSLAHLNCLSLLVPH